MQRQKIVCPVCKAEFIKGFCEEADGQDKVSSQKCQACTWDLLSIKYDSSE